MFANPESAAEVLFSLMYLWPPVKVKVNKTSPVFFWVV